MQRSRRRKLLREAAKGLLPEAVKARDAFRANGYGGTTRTQRRAAAKVRPGFREALARFVEQTR